MPRLIEPGEHVRLEARPHEASLARPLARSLLIAASGIALVLLGLRYGWGIGAAGLLALAAAAGLSILDVWRWQRTRVVVTTNRVVVLHGVARRRAAVVDLERAGPIEVEQSLLGQALGYGTLIAGALEVPYVPNPRALYRSGVST